MPANNPLGYSFEPGSPSVGMSKPAQPSLQPPSAVEYRNLRIPHRQVPGQIAPQALLQGQGGQGIPDVQLLRQLMQMFAPQGAQPGVPGLAGPSQAQGRIGFPQSSPQQAPQMPSAPSVSAAPDGGRQLPSGSGQVRIGAGGLPPSALNDTPVQPPAPQESFTNGQFVNSSPDGATGFFLSNEELQRRLSETLGQVPAMPFSY